MRKAKQCNASQCKKSVQQTHVIHFKATINRFQKPFVFAKLLTLKHNSCKVFEVPCTTVIPQTDSRVYNSNDKSSCAFKKSLIAFRTQAFNFAAFILECKTLPNSSLLLVLWQLLWFVLLKSLIVVLNLPI